MGDLLNVASDHGVNGVQITTLLRKGNISHSRFKSFIKNMTSSGLINKIEFDGHNTFVITDKGSIYLEKYKQFQSLTESFGLEI
jgi:predicted transcriptional regulator|tara:strand:+ start:1138 stop:1389 length:252 start_codon:yes stop_codon:yes gene_type:complete